ncbi:Uncharacterised protein [Mycobacteroides abscessus]|nr:Uncharacterised protein [Mycobacteroides abscessus]
MRRWWRGSPLNGSARNASTSATASSTECWRAPTATTFASLCWRPRRAVSRFQASAARTPTTLFAAICSPLPEPPMTTPSEPGSAATASPAAKQNDG